MPIEGPPLTNMAKVNGTLSAATNAEVLAADMQRQTIHIVNLDASEALYVEFGAAASTTLADDSWVIPSSGTLTLSVKDWPEIRNTVNLISVGGGDYSVRTA